MEEAEIVVLGEEETGTSVHGHAVQNDVNLTVDEDTSKQNCYFKSYTAPSAVSSKSSSSSPSSSAMSRIALSTQDQMRSASPSVTIL